MKRKYMKHSPELKAEVLEYAKGKSLADVRRRYPQVGRSTLSGWVSDTKKILPNEPIYIQKSLEMKPIIRHVPATKEKKIILVCSEDSKSILEVLKGLL